MFLRLCSGRDNASDRIPGFAGSLSSRSFAINCQWSDHDDFPPQLWPPDPGSFGRGFLLGCRVGRPRGRAGYFHCSLPRW